MSTRYLRFKGVPHGPTYVYTPELAKREDMEECDGPDGKRKKGTDETKMTETGPVDSQANTPEKDKDESLKVADTETGPVDSDANLPKDEAEKDALEKAQPKKADAKKSTKSGKHAAAKE